MKQPSPVIASAAKQSIARVLAALPPAGRLLFRGGAADIHRRGAVEPSKAAVEIRQVAKADVVGNRAHLPLRERGIAEHAMDAGEAPRE